MRFEAVSFPTRSAPVTVLDRLDLELAPGETVALVGESGAGKSTVAALLLRLAGAVGGAHHRRAASTSPPADHDAWRQLVAWVPQRPTLLRGTVADNIRLGDRGASRRCACARPPGWPGRTSSSRRLPEGYDTIVGDGGRPLSPGQRRRIGLARAFLRDAPLVILDEPTADLDRDSVERVAEAVGAPARRDEPCCVIAHRPELVGRADRVVALESRRRHPGAGEGGRVTATLRRLLALTDAPRGRRRCCRLLLGALTVLFGVGLMATAGYLISRAAERPAILSLTVAIVAVRFFGIGRPLARYLERLVSHDLALRVLGGVRVRVWRRIEPLAPAQLEGYRRGDLLSRMVADVDALQNLHLRGVGPPLVALVAASCRRPSWPRSCPPRGSCSRAGSSSAA